MNQPIELTSEAQWDQLLADSGSAPVLVFKHSTSCPISAEAHDQYARFLRNARPGIVYALVHVIEARPVSNRIAETLKLKHESPQAILVSGGQVVWHDSHWRLTEEKMTEAVAGLS